MDRVTLPDAEWRHRPGLARLAELLGEARFVGGAVRDTLLEIPVADVDLATPIEPAEVMARLKHAGIKAVPTGIDHGTVTAVLESGPVEVTTLRRDVSTDGRRATVAFTGEWREDAARRDFTINALYADPVSGEVFDYFDGLADLDARRIRFIGDPYRRIAEDHLRILRFFRFLARFGDSPDPAGLEACTARANDLMALSRERIADELLKLLVAKDAVPVVILMLDRGILRPVLPEIETVERLARTASLESVASVAPNAIRRLAALLPPDPAIADEVGARLKLSRAQRLRLLAAATRDSRPAREAAYFSGSEVAIDQQLIWAEDGRAALSAVADLLEWVPPQLPITGGAIVARGIDRGPEVARLMRVIERRWIDEGFPGGDRIDAIADEVVAQT